MVRSGPADLGKIPEAEAKQQEDASPEDEDLPKIERKASAAYWAAEGWDPDERVYTGAACGNEVHHTAVTDPAPASLVECIQPGEPASDSLSAKPTAPADTKTGDEYWDAPEWDADQRVYAGAPAEQGEVEAVAQKLPLKKKKDKTGQGLAEGENPFCMGEASPEEEPEESEPAGISRRYSSAFWYQAAENC